MSARRKMCLEPSHPRLLSRRDCALLPLLASQRVHTRASAYAYAHSTLLKQLCFSLSLSHTLPTRAPSPLCQAMPPPTNGKYIVDIPLSKLFLQGQGDLAILPGEFDPESESSTLAQILSFVPREQTAFDAFFAVPPTYEELLRAYRPFDHEVPGHVWSAAEIAGEVC